jgi:hypothetical protein
MTGTTSLLAISNTNDSKICGDLRCTHFLDPVVTDVNKWLEAHTITH